MKIDVSNRKSHVVKYFTFEVLVRNSGKAVVSVEVSNGTVVGIDFRRQDFRKSEIWRVDQAIANEIEKILDEVNSNDK